MTADGYTPYSVGMSAAQAVEALNRALNLSTELTNFLEYYASSTLPTQTYESGVVKVGSRWYNIANGKIYKAVAIESLLPIWIEE